MDICKNIQIYFKFIFCSIIEKFILNVIIVIINNTFNLNIFNKQISFIKHIFFILI